MTCPLCNAQNIKNLELIDSRSLVKRYKALTKTDFSDLFNSNFHYCECENCHLRFFNPMFIGDERFYNSLQKFDWYYVNDKNEYQYVKNFIHNTDYVLDVGSGKGAFSKVIECGKYIGLDFSLEAKKMALLQDTEVLNESIYDYAKKNVNAFDVVCSFQVLEHVSTPKEFIEAQLLSLKQGGKLVIAVPSEDSFLKYTVNSILNMPPHHVSRWSDKTLHFIAKKYNLILEDIYHEPIQEIHRQWYLMTFFRSLFKEPKLLDNSLRGKFLSKLSALLARFIDKKIYPELLPNGHTVVAVYTKK